jgi:hypothetical protein
MPLPAPASETDTVRHGKDKSAKETRAASKKAAAASRRARRKAAASADSSPAAAESKAEKTKRSESAILNPPPAQKSAAGATAPKNVPIEAPGLSPAAAGADRGSIGPAMPGKAPQISGERRRWPERHGPATSYGDTRRGGPDSGEGGEPAPRANKLMPTNAVHPTERRIKRRVHQNRALLAAAVAVLLGVLILSNQSEPPEPVLGGRQMASRAPASDDWQSGLNPPAAGERPSGQPLAHPGNTPEATAAPEPAAPTTAAEPSRFASAADDGDLTRSEILEMKQYLVRLDLSTGEPNGIADAPTRLAIRLYQKFAGLPVDGEPSAALLADMREVVKMMEARN